MVAKLRPTGISEVKISHKVFRNYANSCRKTRVDTADICNKEEQYVMADNGNAQILKKEYSCIITTEDMGASPSLAPKDV